jgi:hypothetical protein
MRNSAYREVLREVATGLHDFRYSKISPTLWAVECNGKVAQLPHEAVLELKVIAAKASRNAKMRLLKNF